MSHVPVMLAEMLDCLRPVEGGRYLDGTFGGGGYTRAILEAAPRCTVWAIDRDPAAIARGAALAAQFPGRLHLIESRFGDMLARLGEAGISALDGIVLDLGLSSFQIDDPARGFSFRADGPLDMRMGAATRSAADLVAELPETELARILHEFGEERQARRIARAIVAARREAPIATTGRLASVIRATVRRAADGIDPATRSFQALRIVVNDELGEIARALESAATLLAPGGRFVVVSFHSLEDRLVKQFFTRACGRAALPSRHAPGPLTARAESGYRLLTPKPRLPGAAEIARNPRARSARLRALERKGTPPEGARP